MEFREVLALAKKKQTRHDDEVKRIEEQTKRRELEKKKQMEIADKLNRMFTKPALLPTNNVKIPNHSNANKSLSFATAAKDPTLKSQTFSSNTTSVCKPDKATICKDTRDGKVVKAALKSPKDNVVSCPTKPDCKKNGDIQSKPNRLSFTEMMELAKKNVHHTLDKKRPFDDLIPCSVDSKYRKLDSSLVDSSKPIPNALKNVSKPKSHVGSNLPESLVTQKAKLPKLSNSIGSKGFDKTDRGSVMEEVVQHLEKSNRVPYKPLHKNNLSGQRTTNLNRPSKLEMTDSKSSELTKTSKINPLKECKALPKSSTNSKLVNSNFVNKGKSVTAPSKKIVSRTSDNVKAPSTKNFPASNKDAIKNVHMNSNQKSKENPQSRSVDNRTQRTGIAAQLGISFQSQNSANLSVSDSAEDDEYMSDDSFIDDSEALQSKEYARVVRDIHRALKFDPRKYKDVNPYEDLRCMEAKYCDIEKEERRSARLAALEDNEELIRDMMRRKEKMAKKRQQFLNDNDND